MVITIRNWDKYNFRNDIKAPSWFRFGHAFFEDPQFFDFDGDDIKVWLYLLCLASKKSRAEVLINDKHRKVVGRISDKQFKTTISKLEALEVITYVDERERTPTGATQHYITLPTLHNTLAQTEVRASEIYDLYPRKVGKKKGVAKLKTILKNEEDVAKMKIAIENYRVYCQAQKFEPRFIKHFTTFLGEWEDWVDSEHGGSENFKYLDEDLTEADLS